MKQEVKELKHGGHKSPDEGLCLMEAVAFMAGERHSDKPVCACTVWAAFGRRLNDADWPSDEARTKALLPVARLLVGTRDPDKEQARAFQLADLAVRRWAPMALDKAGLSEHAANLRALAPVVDAESAAAAAAAAADAAAGYADAAAGYAAADAADAADAVREDAAACFLAILRGDDPWSVPLPEVK